MALCTGRCFSWTSGLLYLFSVVCGLLATVCLYLNNKNSNGQCMLFMELDSGTKLPYGSPRLCDYALYCSLACSAYPLVLLLINGLTTMNQKRGWVVFQLAVSVTISLGLLVSAIILVTGFKIWCDLLIDKMHVNNSSCFAAAQSHDDLYKPNDPNMVLYYDLLVLAQSGNLGSILMWIFLCITFSVNLCQTKHTVVNISDVANEDYVYSERSPLLGQANTQANTPGTYTPDANIHPHAFHNWDSHQAPNHSSTYTTQQAPFVIDTSPLLGQANAPEAYPNQQAQSVPGIGERSDSEAQSNTYQHNVSGSEQTNPFFEPAQSVLGIGERSEAQSNTYQHNESGSEQTNENPFFEPAQ